MPSRQHIRMLPGTYLNPGVVRLDGTRVVTGLGADLVSVTNAAEGPVFVMDVGSHVTIARLRIFGARNGAFSTVRGNGIYANGADLRILDSIVTGNQASGLDAISSVEVRDSTFSENGDFGLAVMTVSPSVSTIERTLVTANGSGVTVEGSVAVRNVFVTRNQNDGVVLNPGAVSPSLSFATVVGNRTGIVCTSSVEPDPDVKDSIVANNDLDVLSPEDCSLAGLLTTTAGNFAFVSPTVAPFDYHLAPGSVAIDVATGTTDTDFDGDSRPKGAAADVGADEAF